MTLRKISTLGRGLTGGGLLLLWTKLRCPYCGGRIQDLKAECCATCGEEMDYDAKN